MQRIIVLFTVLTVLSSARVEAADVSSNVELLGNPFAQRYAAANEFSFRPVTSMHRFGDRIFIGHGSTGGGGPTDLWTFDLPTDSFRKEGMIFEEIVDAFRTFDNQVYLNGRDSMGKGSLYRREANGWQSYTLGADSHYYGVYKFNGNIFAISGRLDIGWPAIAISTNDCSSFQTLAQPNNFTVKYQYDDFFEFKGILYASAGNIFASTNGRMPFMIKYTGDPVTPFTTQFQRFNEFFPDATQSSLRDFNVYQGNAIFLANVDFFVTPDIETVKPTKRTLPFTGVRSMKVFDDTIYVLTSTPRSNPSGWAVRILSSTNTIDWTEVLLINTDSPGVAMEKVGDDFYIGLGGNFPVLASSGNVLRVRGAARGNLSLPLVNLGQADDQIWESSDVPASFIVRRSGFTNVPLSVHYEIVPAATTAVAGLNFQPLSGVVTFAAGANQTNVNVSPLRDAALTGDATLTIRLVADAAYTLVGSPQATLKILDETNGIPTPNGLALWVKADTGVITNGTGAVTAWQDARANGRSFIQGNALNRPVVGVGPNGLPAVKFNGSQSLDFGSLGESIYFAAIAFTNEVDLNSSTTQTPINFMGYAEGGRTGLEFGEGQAVSIYNFSNPNATIPAGPHVMILSQPAHAADYQLWLDGNPLSFAKANSRRTITLYADRLRLACREPGQRFFRGAISEVMLYNRPLSTGEVESINNYLHTKYQVAIAAPDANIDDPPNGAIFPTGGPLHIAASSSAPTSTLELYFNGDLIRRQVGSPISLTLPSMPAGDKVLKVVSTDIIGARATSSVVTVHFEAPIPQITAVDDFVTVSEDGFVDIQPLANDNNGNIAGLDIIEVVGASHGTTVQTGTTVRYTPDPDYFGVDSFWYTSTDGFVHNSGGVVHINVLSLNDSPTLDALPNLTLPENSGVTHVPLTGISSGRVNENQALIVTAESSNPTLTGALEVTYASPQSSGDLAFTVARNEVGSALITVSVDDGTATVQRQFQVSVPPFVSIVTGADLPGATESVTYNRSLQAQGGSLTYTWTVVNGTVPPGLTLSSAGVLQGIGTQIGDFAFTARVEDGNGLFAERQFNIRMSLWGYISFAAATNFISELQGTAFIQVNRSTPAVGPMSIRYTTIGGPAVNGSAVANEDFQDTTGVLTWGDGDTSPRQIELAILPDDFVEGPEVFQIALTELNGLAGYGRSNTVVVINDSPFAIWKLQHYGTSATSGEIADEADEDNDGLPNIMEYAFGSDPFVPSPEALPKFQLVTDSGVTYLALSFPYDPAAVDVETRVQIGAPIGNWVDGSIFSGSAPSQPNTNTVEVSRSPGPIQTIVVRDATSITEGPQRFMRVTVQKKQ